MNNEFEPFQPVLVKDYDHGNWEISFYAYYDETTDRPYISINGTSWRDCIPYKGNEDLLGTTNKPNCQKKLKFGDKVMVRHYHCHEWKKAIFIEMLVSGKPYNVLTKEEKKIECFGLCKKGWDEG